MKLQLTASASILAPLASCVPAAADHDYLRAAAAGFSVVKPDADIRHRDGARREVGNRPGERRASGCNRRRISLNVTTLCCQGTQTDPPGQALTKRNRARQRRTNARRASQR
ncbi:hypothetical protein OI25_7833 (plasmid) [Paraburkholderia fungorum]|jgi:hypothetical protein|uniref:Uncharacterized protein n=1 Tax=Paraburkholderia fungorum TaxID=134537 RepID=A0AAU8SR15_9BURK|nr:hypothetical protein OI25_7833 [Paraburkholderia fungorum]